MPTAGQCCKQIIARFEMWGWKSAETIGVDRVGGKNIKPDVQRGKKRATASKTKENGESNPITGLDKP